MKLISNQINPHFTLWDSFRAASALLYHPNPDLNNFFGTSNVRLTNTARSALGIIADAVKPRKRIALPAFICAVVATPFLSRGYQIEWIDTDDQGVIDPEDFRKKAGKVGLVVVPHIFGQPAPLEAIYEIAQQHDIFVVEDGAHLLNTNFDHCDAKIWSFGREKVVSCVSGGALLWPNKSPYYEAFKEVKLDSPSWWWQTQHALQPIIFALGQPWWRWGGKLLPRLARALKILPLAVTPSEKNGQEDIAIKSLGPVQTRILYQQVGTYEKRQKRAQIIAKHWQKMLPKNLKTTVPESTFRVIVTFANATAKTTWLKQHFANTKAAWHLQDWDGIPISPSRVDLSAFGYQPGQCPRAEAFAVRYITLPTNIRTRLTDLKVLEKSFGSSTIHPPA